MLRLKVADTFADILKVLDYCDKNSVELPKFVIQDWKFFVKFKSSAEKTVEKMKASKPEVSAMLKEKMFIDVLKQVPPSMTHTDIESPVPSALKQ